MLAKSVSQEFGQGMEPRACFCSKMPKFSSRTRQLGLLSSWGMETFRSLYSCASWLILVVNWDHTWGYDQSMWSLLVAYTSLVASGYWDQNGHSELRRSIYEKHVICINIFECAWKLYSHILLESIGYKRVTKLPDLVEAVGWHRFPLSMCKSSRSYCRRLIGGRHSYVKLWKILLAASNISKG